MALSSGERLGPYEILAPLGAGGMGEVYRANDARLDREVAIKVLPERLANDADALARFEREGKAVAALSHPNILAIHDVGHDHGTSYVVTELLEGETLRERLRRSAIPWRKAVEIGIEIAEGLSAAHSKGVIHRDLKPENLFITTAGHMKILDFGLARVAPGAAVPAELQANTPTMTLDTRPGTVLGTVNYMSPEQISGRVTDPRTDIFSFGCVLYEMLSGRRAFGGESVAEITTAILRDEPPTLADSGRVVPAELDRVIMRCHEKKPEQRIQSARDLSFALRDLLSDSVPSNRTTTHAGRRTRTMLGVQLAVGVVVVAALLLTLNVGGWRERLFSRPQVGRVSSLAVLPMENVSRDPEQEYFVDGMTEALISDLAKIGGLKVISRTSVMRYKATTKSLPEIARELNVDAVVEGSVLRVGDRVRITAQLIHAATDQHLWAESYDRDLRDVLRLHSEVARTIAQEIKVTLTPQEQARMVEARPVNPEAHEAYLKGRFYWNKRTPDGLKKAVDYFEQAVSLDPAWPLGYAGLGDAYVVMPSNLGISPSEAMSKARAAAAKALELDESLAEAHATMALIAAEYEWDWATADREYQRALGLSPNYATGHQWYARLLMFTGRHDEAIREITKTQKLDPLSLIISLNVGIVHRFTGDFEQAETWFRKTLELDAGFALARSTLASSLFLQGRLAEAITEAREVVRLSNNNPSALLGYMCAKAGQPEEARRILDELTDRSKEAYVWPADIALVHAGLDEKDKMFEWLERAYQDRSVGLLFMLIDPLLAEYRSDPRFADLVRRVGLPPLAVPRGSDPPLSPLIKGGGGASSPLDKGGPRGVPSGKIMLAVLPFENLSRDPEQDYFSDGLTEEMISQLSRLNPKKLGVIARTSAMHYKNTAKTIDAIGRELGVAYIVEGSVRRAGDRVRITAQLIQVSDQTHLWAENYERDLKDIFALQSDVAERVAGSLTVELLPGAASKPAKDRLVNTEAYNAYLLGEHLSRRGTKPDLEKAVGYFLQAIKIDSDYAPAWAALGQCYALQAANGYEPVHDTNRKAREAVERALALDGGLAMGHWAMGFIKMGYDWDWDGANEEFETALALEPGNVKLIRSKAQLARVLGNPAESEALQRRAIELDPLDVVARAGLANSMLYAGRAKEAEAAFQKVLELDPNYLWRHNFMGSLYLQTGRPELALIEYEQVTDPGSRLFWLAQVYHTLGRKDEADAALAELIDVAQVEMAFQIAGVYAYRGDADKAFEWLERAYAQRDHGLAFLKVVSSLENLRGDPRYAAFLQKMRLPP